MTEPTEIELPFASATDRLNPAKITGRPPGKGMQRRKAPPIAGASLYGPQTAVRFEVTPRIGSELWLQISTSVGVFWVLHDCSLLALVQQIQHGGHWVWYKPS